MRVPDETRPLRELGAEAVAMVDHVRATRQPLLLTDAGDAVAVLLDAREFESLAERLAILDAIYRAEAEIAEGQVVSHEAAKARIRAALGG